MKINHKYTYIILLILLIVSCNRKQRNEYSISGQLENIKGSKLIAVKELTDTLIIDTIPINEKGEFKIKGIVDTLTIISLYFDETTVSPYFLIDKDWEVNIKGDINYPDLIQVKGGDVNNELSSFKENIQDLLKSRVDLLIKSNMNQQDTLLEDRSNTDLKNINFELLNKASDYVKKNPNKISSVLIINNFFKNEESLDRLSESLNNLKGKALDFPLTDRLKAYETYLRESTKGSKAPNFRVKDINGKEFNLTDLNNKYVFLTFTSSENQFKEWYDLIKKEDDLLKNGKVVEKLENGKSKKVTKKYNIAYVMVVKDIEKYPINPKSLKGDIIVIPAKSGWANKIFEDYNVTKLPFNFLIAPNGRIEERNFSLINLQPSLDRLPSGLIETKLTKIR